MENNQSMIEESASNSSKTTAGKVAIVGAGPGDPELVTLKARRLIESCNCLLHDHLIDSALLGWCAPECEVICVGKRAGRHCMDQSEISRLMVEKAMEGRDVVRLKGGEPGMFGRLGEELAALRAAGIDFEVVPAVTSAFAAAASLGIPLTDRDCASGVALLTGHEQPARPGSDGVDWRTWGAMDRTTLVIYMGVQHLEQITSDLVDGGRAVDTPAAAVQWASTPMERRVVGTLGDLALKVNEAALGAPAVLIVGEVVGRR